MNINDKKMTIDDVATALGVSKTTVSRAISGKGRISVETTERILEYIEAHDYVPNAFAQGLAQSKTYNIGISVPDDFAISDMQFFRNCLAGVCEYASSRGYDVMLSLTSANDISRLERMVNNRKVDGVILSRTLIRDFATEYLKSKDIPFVTIGSNRDSSIIQVDNDHEGACRELTFSLLKNKAGRMVLLCGNQDHMVTQSRLQGFMRGIRESGYEITPDMIFYDIDEWHLKELTMKIKSGVYGCVICMDDTICARILDLFKEEGIRIPNDVRLASFYNSTLLERNIPSVTSLNFDAQELGQVACKTLLDLIDGLTVPTRSLLGYELSLKGSTENLR